MVEFGLKLEDNKVAAWGDHYIRYELLKESLDKCQKAQTKLDQLKEKRPDTFQTVQDSLRNGTATPKASRDNLTDLGFSEQLSARSAQALHSIREREHESEQEEPLIPTAEASAETGYGSIFEGPSLLKRSVSTLSDYLGISFERQVRDATKDLDKHTQEFDALLLEDIDKVNSFYNRKLADSQGRLDLLKESVSQLYSKTVIDAEVAQQADDEYLETPLVRNRKRSYVQDAVEKIQKRSSQLIQRTHNISTEKITVEEEVDDGTEKGLKPEKIKMSREVESIQRALLDLYRRDKLLQNFAIMNYTGFIKIVKKHDKTLKDRKGRYKKAIRAESICNEGKAVEKLAESMENLYANWFCDRNLSEARAQLLPKRGDGLEMDWSQMRLGCKKQSVEIAHQYLLKSDFSPSCFFCIATRPHGHVFHSGIVGMLGLCLGDGESRRFDHRRTHCIPCVSSLRGITDTTVVLGLQCLDLDKVPDQLHILI
jgi:hypothetical protein